MRVFIAILAEPKLQKPIKQWQEQHNNLPVRWVAPKNLHFTLIPPWEELNVQKLITKLGKQIKGFAPFKLLLNHLTLGTNAKTPSLIWAVGPTSDQLCDLRDELQAKLKAKPSSRPLKPHITLARFTKKDYFRFPKKQLHEEIRWEQIVTSVCLMESKLESSGTDYKLLQKIKLTK
jgi:RNA 2',3'-cyclic 3'-phosphodiesterase